MKSDHTILITAPAKINLFLHITGKRDNGYHELQSLITFANFGDKIKISPENKFSFSFDSTSENMPIDENNIIVCAAISLANALEKNLNCHIHLTKKIPIGAGLGGGSSNAAAVIEGLLKFWQTDIDKNKLDKILIELGADVPACFYKKPCYLEGIGEIITPIKSLPTLSGLIVYPNKNCSTQDIFERYNSKFLDSIQLPENFYDEKSLLNFLDQQRNDLTDTAIQKIPHIKSILETLHKQKGCLLSRMSGSGSACFGLFKNSKELHEAAHKIQDKNPKWWVQEVKL